MKILHVVSSVNPETGGPIEVIMPSASVLLAQGCHQEILSLDSPLDPWSRTVTIKLRHGHPQPALSCLAQNNSVAAL